MNTKRKAIEIIQGVYKNDDYASLSLQNVNDEYVNMGLLTEIVYGTLRNARLLRHAWSPYVRGELSEEINALMDVGVYMLHRIESIPDYAVVNDCVELSKEIEHEKYTALVNAVLKKVSRKNSIDVKIKDNESLALATSFPEWLVNMLVAHYGFEMAQEFCLYSLKEANVALRVNTNRTSVDKLLEDKRFKQGKLVSDALYYDGNIIKTDIFKDHLVSIQDEASQMVAHYLNADPNDKILDLASAPGTKSAHIALLRNDQGRIDAVDVHEHRVQLIKNMMELLELNSIHPLVYDGRQIDQVLEKNSFDKVLLDAPCSGLGVLRQKPEIKLHLNPSDIDDLEVLQSELLESASQMVKVGGEVVYSTCTFNKKENERQIKKFLDKHDNFNLIDEKNILGFKENTDTFYMAKLVRTR